MSFVTSLLSPLVRSAVSSKAFSPGDRFGQAVTVIEDMFSATSPLSAFACGASSRKRGNSDRGHVFRHVAALGACVRGNDAAGHTEPRVVPSSPHHACSGRTPQSSP